MAYGVLSAYRVTFFSKPDSDADQSWGNVPTDPLGSRPFRRSLVQECIQALAKIVAHVTVQDHIGILLGGHLFLDAAQGFLGDAQGERRAGGHGSREFVRTDLEGRVIAQHLAQQSNQARPIVGSSKQGNRRDSSRYRGVLSRRSLATPNRSRAMRIGAAC
jgi:hypothetical protein